MGHLTINNDAIGIEEQMLRLVSSCVALFHAREPPLRLNLSYAYTDIRCHEDAQRWLGLEELADAESGAKTRSVSAGAQLRLVIAA
jgi:hypothetical protein